MTIGLPDGISPIFSVEISIGKKLERTLIPQAPTNPPTVAKIMTNMIR
jgi:hypothetical protein